MKNIESNYVKDVTTPIYGCPEISKLGQSTLENTQDKFKLHFTTSYAITIKKKIIKKTKKPKKKQQKLTSKQQLGMGSGDGGCDGDLCGQ